MRVDLPGVSRGDGFRISFEGRSIAAWPGESIAAALLNAGEAAMRATPLGEPRGLWCGMGVCGECRVVVDGTVRRACMEMAAPGQVIARASARACAGPTQATDATPLDDMRAPDLLVIGAGPAGLSAARVAALSGLSVVVADERGKAGGQYFKQPGTGFVVDEARLDDQSREGRALVAATAAAGVRFLHGATLWAAYRDAEGAPVACLAVADRALEVRPRRLVLAMGAYERPWPVPGWTLPGVVTSGAAQTLLRAYSSAPGRRVLVAGNGPLNVQVACELARAGVDVVALVEAARAPGPRDAADLARMAVAAPGLVRDGVGMTLSLRRRGVPVLNRHVVTRISGRDRAEMVEVAPIGADGTPDLAAARRFEVDAVALGYGFLPQVEAARALGCATRLDATGGTVVERDDSGATTVPHVRVIGDGGGLGGARIALAQGVLAGAAICEELGRQAGVREIARARTRLARHRRFQAALWRIYAAPELPAPAPDALLCRCESITTAQVDGLVDDGARDLAAIKRATRAGMGACAGRYCTALIEARLGGAGALAGFAPRAPFKPVTIGAIASLARP
jgi:NADPH-dependent 2,4-dienoyl-CoA reductase/sulfur reductase-like enzyme